METLFNISNRLIEGVSDNFRRSLSAEIDRSQRLIEIRGSRGVGKTTLMLQLAKDLRQNGKESLYVTLDLPYFYNNSLFDLAEELVKYGITHLFLDEVHRYPAKHENSDWSLELKNIYDAFPELKIVYSGSSILHLYKAKGDLSRRKAGYLMSGLSFREFLQMRGILDLPPVTLSKLLSNHIQISREISSKVKVLPHFKEYLKHGYYPFYDGNQEVYIRQLQDVINLVIDTDLVNIMPVSPGSAEQLKRLLGAVSTTSPYVPNMTKLAGLLQISDYRTLGKYLHLLEEAQLLNLLRTEKKGNKKLQKPDKIYLNNTNLTHALGYGQADTGTARETFFFNQLRVNEKVNHTKKGDFTVNHNTVFEIGGKNKTARQISDVPNSFVVADDIETGFGNKIPLWLFGFLY